MTLVQEVLDLAGAVRDKINLINPRKVTSITSSATPTPNCDTTNHYYITALAAGAVVGAPTGTPTEGQSLLIIIKDNGTARSLSFNAAFVAVGVTLPTTTVLGKWLYVGSKWNTTAAKWHVIALAQEA